MLSRLISLLGRLPAVKWALSRLRPAPRSGSIEIAETAPAPDTAIQSEPSRSDEDIPALAPVAEDKPADAEIAENPSPASAEISVGEVSLAELPIEIEPIVADDVVLSVPANDPPPAAAVAPSPALALPTPEIHSAPKADARATEATDRAALIRRRWAETGIRMWNPRHHGRGDATLNIQGRVELLPPAPGETMPRYDKLEFKLLGGQIVCEGVIVEAPVRARPRTPALASEAAA